ncbi:MAG: hypothetical protein COZ89_00580, partial [Candidatus Nealsonbacteria bacterium CG_4_8_14_3_um_filter_37_23]
MLVKKKTKKRFQQIILNKNPAFGGFFVSFFDFLLTFESSFNLTHFWLFINFGVFGLTKIQKY